VNPVLRSFFPPVLLDAARAARDAMVPAEWEWVPGGWVREPAGGGWEHESVVATQRERWPALVAAARGHGPLALSAEAGTTVPDDIATHNTMMVFAYVLARAARGRERLAWLDWGGGLGQYAVLGRALLPEVPQDYHCRDTAQLAAAGRALLPDARFYDNDAECLARDYDLVMASSSLQYREDWAATLAGLARVARGFLFVTRLPIVERAGSYVALQRAHRHGYRTEYPGWVLNHREFLDRAAGLGLTLEREFLIDERPRIRRAPGPCRYRGFLFRPAAAAGTR
jgi:putative methyltransferase (TIGR04325 family)